MFKMLRFFWIIGKRLPEKTLGLKILLSLLFVFLIGMNNVFSQTSTESIKKKNPRIEKPFNITLYGGSPTFFASISLSYFIRPDLEADLGAGAFGIYGGGRYHIWGDDSQKRWTPYTGILVADYGEFIGLDYAFFVPLGYHYNGEKGFVFAAELLFPNQYLFAEGFYTPWAGLKLGYSF